MPRRLLVASAIIRDVGPSVPDCHREILENLADRLDNVAKKAMEETGLSVAFTPDMEDLLPSVNKLLMSFDPEIDPNAPRGPLRRRVSHSPVSIE